MVKEALSYEEGPLRFWRLRNQSPRVVAYARSILNHSSCLLTVVRKDLCSCLTRSSGHDNYLLDQVVS